MTKLLPLYSAVIFIGLAFAAIFLDLSLSNAKLEPSVNERLIYEIIAPRDPVRSVLYKDVKTASLPALIIADEEQAMPQSDPFADFISYGSLNLNMQYGDSHFTKKKYRRYDTDSPVSSVISKGFRPEHDMQLHMEGRLANRLTVYIDHDNQSENNRYLMNYKAIDSEELIREINAGEIDIKFNHSKYAVYDNTSDKGMGVDATIAKKGFSLKAFGSALRGKSEKEFFRGNTSQSSSSIPEYKYTGRTCYQLEPYMRYDGIRYESEVSFPKAYENNTFTSAKFDFKPEAVNVSPDGFEVYMDEQISNRNYEGERLPIDGGCYKKLSNGSDYSVNYTAGLITFLRDIPKSSRIFVLYKLENGASSDPAVNDSLFPGRHFVFIKYGYSIDEDSDRDGNYYDTNGDGKMNLDIYEVRSRFYLGEKNIMAENFSLRFYTASGELLTNEQLKKLGKYSISYSEGIISFNLREPFKSLLPADKAKAIYGEIQPESVSSDSSFYIMTDFSCETSGFRLKHTNIIEESERIKINDRVIAPSLYFMDYISGYLSFKNSSNPQISSETLIEISYQYETQGSQGSEFIGGLRADYEFCKNLAFGGSMLISNAGGTETIPNVGREPARTIVAEGDLSVNLNDATLTKAYNKVTGSKRTGFPFELGAYAEYARSFKKTNTYGKGLIDNMESADETLSLSMSEKSWILASTDDQLKRGLLHYRYFRNPENPGELKGPGSGALSVDYSVKPGPYNVATGHIDFSAESESSQMSLVFDYDFTQANTNRVAVAIGNFYEAADLSGLSYIEISCKLESEEPTAEIALRLDAGRINEDSDGDGILNTEDKNGNGFLETGEDRGYAFNGNNPTVVGSGPDFSTITEGDGIFNTEDLNGNGILDTVEACVSFPNTPSALTVAKTKSGWQKIRIYVDSEKFSADEAARLKAVEAVRFTITKKIGTRGRLYVDRIAFVSSKWCHPKIDENAASPENIKISYLNSLSDEDYRNDSFPLSNSKYYESAYGSKSGDELNAASESALKIDYNITGGSKTVSVERRFDESLDIRFYKTLNIWYNCRSKCGEEKLKIRIGSSEEDWNEYFVTLKNPRLWQNASFKLNGDSSAEFPICSIKGNPDMKRISFIRLFIEGQDSTGEIWINDIYVSDPISRNGSAHWYETEFKTTAPLLVTRAGAPVLSDIRFKYIKKGHSEDFSTLGQTDFDIRENYHQIFSSVAILPDLHSTFDYVLEETETDSRNENVPKALRGKTKRSIFYFTVSYVPNANLIPNVYFSNKSEIYRNTLSENIFGKSIRSVSSNFSHSPVLIISEHIDNFLWGTFSGCFKLDTVFRKETISRTSDSFDTTSLSALTSAGESRKSQKTASSLEIAYISKIFFIKPSVSFASEELVDFNGKNDEAVSDFSGSFHFPFVHSGSMKLLERSRGVSFSAGINDFGYISPTLIMEAFYREDSFIDGSQDMKRTGFSRCRDAGSSAQTKINVPINLRRLSDSLIKSFNASFNRSVWLTEQKAPYEGEGTGAFDEDYGISRSLLGITSAGFNLFRYFPGCFFAGRNWAAKGRDYVYGRLNERVALNGKYQDYDNSLKLLESWSLNSVLDFGLFSLDTGGALSQICFRANTCGIPVQTVTGSLFFRFNFDLMNIFSFGFFRPNKAGLPYRAASVDFGYAFNSTQAVTSNLMENEHSLSFGFSLKEDRKYFRISFGTDIRHEVRRIFISKKSLRDDIYIKNMEQVNSNELDIGYTFSILYETNLQWLYNLFVRYYTLSGEPTFRNEFSMAIKRYDYTETVSPRPYDLYMLTSILTLDLHKHVQGSIEIRTALENYRDVGTNYINQQIFSYDINFRFTLLF